MPRLPGYSHHCIIDPLDISRAAPLRARYMSSSVDPQQLGGALVVVVIFLAATLTAIWVSLIVWAFRDMRSRSRDIVSQVLAAVVVTVLNVPGLLVYLILRPRETLSEQYQRALEEEALLQDIEDRPVCPGCGHVFNDTWRVCPHCHTRLKKPCLHCGQLLDLKWQICPYCEQPQADQSYTARSSSARMSSIPYAAADGTESDLS